MKILFDRGQKFEFHFMPFIKIKEIDFYYEREGSGPPLLVLAGFTTNHTLWKRCVGALSSDYDLIIFDPRGAGKSATPEGPYSIAQMADDVADWLDALALPSAYVIGFSMGSLILQQLCLSHPRRVKKAILATPFARLPAKSKLHLQTMGKLLRSGIDLKLVVENALPWLFSDEFLSHSFNVERAIHHMASNPYPQSPEGYAAQGEALLKGDLSDQIEAIQTPTLIVAGQEDVLTPLHCAEYLVEKISDSELITLPGVGHMLPLERSQELMDIARSFFKQ